MSLLAFIIVYLLVFGAGVYYIARLILKGPVSTSGEAYGAHGVETPPIVTDLVADKGGDHA
jgi:cytochrome d ubiquinol oxidase subunit I